ncbi:hypothetical protein BC826DRAFT_1079120 [Russula brevipes]|nr:hypothetical protein BC826DRAFT_1079120 [Russula brevipes]
MLSRIRCCCRATSGELESITSRAHLRSDISMRSWRVNSYRANIRILFMLFS